MFQYINKRLTVILCFIGSLAVAASPEREVTGLIVQAPSDWTDRKPKGPLPDTSAVLIRHTESKIGAVIAAISHVAYKPGVTPDLDSAATGAIAGLKSNPNVSNLQSTVTATTVSGKPTKRVSVSADARGTHLRMESLVIVAGQDLWSIQTVFTPGSAQAEQDAMQFLETIKLAKP